MIPRCSSRLRFTLFNSRPSLLFPFSPPFLVPSDTLNRASRLPFPVSRFPFRSNLVQAYVVCCQLLHSFLPYHTELHPRGPCHQVPFTRAVMRGAKGAPGFAPSDLHMWPWKILSTWEAKVLGAEANATKLSLWDCHGLQLRNRRRDMMQQAWT